MRLSSGISLAAALTLASAAAAQPGARPAAPDLRTASVVDLTHAFDSETLYWPTSPTTFELKTLTSGMTPGGWFYSANSFCAPEHGGTHLDAPIHFGRGQRTADQVPVRQLVAPAVVIDVTRAAAADPDYRLTVADVRAWEKRHGTIPGGSIVLLRTGWSKRWPDRKRYFGDDTPGDASNLHFPSYGEDAVALLVRERRVGAIGVDTASIDHGRRRPPRSPVAAGRTARAWKTWRISRASRKSGAWIVALPMKIAGGSGGPLRAIALVPRP